jgi:hypothetical protein
MTTIHGFLFSALGFSFNKYLSIYFFAIIGVIGITISFSTWIVLRHSIKAIDKYVKKFEDQEGIATSRIIGHVASKRTKFLLPPNFLPIVFGFGWLFVLISVFSDNLDPTIGRPLPSASKSLPQLPSKKVQGAPILKASPPQVPKVPTSQKTPLQKP